MKQLILFSLIFLLSYSCGNTDENKNSAAGNKFPKSDNIGNIDTHTIVFERKNEPNENAFSLLVPKGWLIAGGIFRVDPLAQGGPSQSIAAKLDFAIQKDEKGSAMIRWLPDILYFDARNSPAGQMGLFPQGSNYQGMTVLNLMSSESFISQIAFPYAHPSARNVTVVETKKLNDVSQNYSRRVKQAIPYSTMSYDASLVKIKYEEDGLRFEEIIVAIIENWGQLGAGMWGNKETFYIRAIEGELNNWESIFSVVQNSVKLNLQWLIGEIKGQATRGQIAVNTQKEIERIGREISSHRQKTNAEIHNDMFLTLTEQEEYVNPYTNEIEMGTNQWKYRWINENGDIIYTDHEEYDPNVDINLNRNDYKRSKIRKRFPQ